MQGKRSSRPLLTINAHAAGLDVGSTFHVVAVPPESADESVRTFRSFTGDLQRLADWLKEVGVTSVAMESTSVYWIPVFEILEARGFEVILVNARDAKNVPGRKTDVNDAQWLQQLHQHGLLRGSFRPHDRVVRLRALLRHRERLVDSAATHIQLMQKALMQMNVQLQHAVTDITGVTGMKIIRDIAAKKPGQTVNILTHCNAGWLATVDYGTALAPIYLAHDAGIPLHVWVDETRPRNQGASLTAFELGSHGVPHAIVADNAGGHYMQQGQVDLVIVGTDRVTANGDVANKIGTYLKALAAKDNNVPFYVALPSSTIDWTLADGRAIPIEERSQDEVLKMTGRLPDGQVATVEIAAPGASAANPGFDITPARLVTGLITERGTCAATTEGLRGLFPKS